MRLGSITTTRKQLAKQIRLYKSGDLEEQEIKTLAYLFSVLLSFFKAEKEFDIESRLEVIEKQLQERGVKRL